MNLHLFKTLLFSIVLTFLFTFKAQALQIFCPGDQWVSCTDELWDLSNYPNATYHDYDGYHDAGTPSVTYYLNMCDVGTIERTWTVYAYGTSVSCTQTFYVEGGNFGYNDITWPTSGLVLDGCNPNTDPDYLPYGYGVPTYNTSTECAIIAVNYSDQIFTISNTCKKLLRTWQIMDCCAFNSYTGQGLYTHTQIIKLVDSGVPLIEEMEDVVQNSNNCEDAYVHVPMLWTNTSSCGGTYTITNNSPYADHDGSDASGVYPLGTTQVKYTVHYGCGGKTYFTINVVVKDSKSPVPYCLASLNLALMGIDNDGDGVNEEGMVEVWASDLDYGSYHTCPSHYPLRISFSSDPTDKVRVFTCDEVGDNFVEMWVTDKFGNQNYCIVKVNIQNNAANITNCKPIQIIELDDITVSSESCTGAYVNTPLNWLDSTYCDGIDTLMNNSPFADDMGKDASGNYPTGTIKVTYKVFYNCGEEVHYTFNVIVENNNTEIAPSPVCVNGLNVALMGIDNNNDGINDEGRIEIWASDLDHGSFHTCQSHDPLIFSFSADSTDILRVYTCDEVGNNIAELWVTDRYGNQSHCDVIISIQNNGANITDCEPEILVTDTIPDIIASTDNCESVFVETPMTWLDSTYCGGINAVSINSSFSDNNWNSASGTYPVGSTTVQYTVHYNCGETILYIHNIIVEDNTRPQPYCIVSLGLPLAGVDNDSDGMNEEGLVQLWASDLDLGSYHVCPSHYPLILSFSEDTTDIAKLFTCNEIGDNTVELWVTDRFGNQEYCTVVVNVQNNAANITDCEPENIVVETIDDIVVSSANCEGVFVDVTMDWLDSTYCGGIDEVIIFSPYTDDMNHASGTYPLGINAVKYKVQYTCGEKIIYSHNIIVNGSINPQPYCVGAMDLELIGIDNDGDGTDDDASVQLLASTLDFGSHHSCNSYYPLSLSFTSDTNDSIRLFSCDDIGQTTVKLWVTDKFGNQEYCSVDLSILHNDVNIPDCEPTVTSVLASGSIQSLVGEYIDNVEVAIEKMMDDQGSENQSPYHAQKMTDRFGFYEFVKLEMYTDYQLDCQKELDMHEFVSKEDVRALYLHIRGREVITDPYFLIAADLDDNGVIDRKDLYAMYDFAHGIKEDLGIEKTHVFIPSSSVIANVEDYYNNNFTSKIMLHNIDKDSYDMSFKLIVKGDLYSTKTNSHGLRDGEEVSDSEIMAFLDRNNQESLSVYPNPFSNEINIALRQLPETDVTFTLYQMDGKQLYKSSQSATKNLNITMEGINSGVYYYQVKYGTTSYKGKLIKL